MTMKAPKYAALGVQKMLDAGMNGFAAQLLAESHADKPERFGDETVFLMASAHNGVPVYMLVSTQIPDKEQFAGWPTSDTAPDELKSQIARAVDQERERCAKIADAYADENRSMASDNIILDPILSGTDLSPGAFAKSDAMTVDMCVASSMMHAAQNIAAEIRKGQI